MTEVGPSVQGIVMGAECSGRGWPVAGSAPLESEMIAVLEFLAITSFILTCLLWLVAAA